MAVMETDTLLEPAQTGRFLMLRVQLVQQPRLRAEKTVPAPRQRNSGDVGWVTDLSREGVGKQEVGNEGREVEEMKEAEVRETGESGMERSRVAIIP